MTAGKIGMAQQPGESGDAGEWIALVEPEEEKIVPAPERRMEPDLRGRAPARPEPGGRADGAGIMSLVQSRDITYERLPMLEVVFDRLERMLTTSVRNFTSENVDISLENISAQRFSDYMNTVSTPAMIAIFKAVQWDNYGLIIIDSAMIYSIVDVLLGGRRGTAPMRIEGRPYTTIEASLVERLVRLILDDLGQAFAPITPIAFRFERMETNPRFAAIARPGNGCIVFRHHS